MGSRIKRELVCIGCPPPPSLPPDNDELSPQIPNEPLVASMLFEVYPNPFLEQLTVKIDEATLSERPLVQLLDVAGRVIRKMEVVS